MLRILHVSDLHFGVYSVAEQVKAIEQMIQREAFDVVAVSGDLTQRARRREFARARKFLELAAERSHTIVVPGNHDVAWWRAPMHIGFPRLMYTKWTKYLGRDTEPVLRLPQVTIVGLNTAHGISRHTLTKRPRDLSIIGDLRDTQIDWAAREFDAAAADARRVVMMHHNPVAGEISGRIGLWHSAHVLDRFARLGVDLILCGHDHQEAIHTVEKTARSIIVSTAGTITTRLRGGRPASVNEITLNEADLVVRTRIWRSDQHAFMLA